MQTRQITEIFEPQLRVTFKRQKSELLTAKLTKEVQLLLKKIILNNEILGETMSKGLSRTNHSKDAIECTRKIQGLIDQHKVLNSIISGSLGATLTIENPKLLFSEIKDRTGLKICFSKSHKESLLIRIDHKLLIDALVALVREVDKGDNSTIDVNVYQEQDRVCFQMRFGKSVSDKLENSLTFQYVLQTLNLMQASYERKSNQIIIKFKKME